MQSRNEIGVSATIMLPVPNHPRMERLAWENTHHGNTYNTESEVMHMRDPEVILTEENVDSEEDEDGLNQEVRQFFPPSSTRHFMSSPSISQDR